MSYMMTKLLPLFVYPLGLAIVLLLLSRLFSWLGRREAASLLVICAVALLWLCSMPRFSDWAMSTLEKEWPSVPAARAPRADAIVLLGGMTRGLVPGTDLPDLSGSADRLFHAAELYRAGKAPMLLLTGGNAPGYEPEALSMKRVLLVMGIPEEAMLLEDHSRNTRQNARFSAAVLRDRQIHSILLVTSAYHMRRAKLEFERQGFEVLPAATDYQVVKAPRTPLDWLPAVGALNQTTRAMKEYLGLMVTVVAPGL